MSSLICTVQAIGHIVAGQIEGKLPDQKFFLTTEGCELNNGTHFYTLPPPEIPEDYINPWKERNDSWDTLIFSMTYAWLPCAGIGISIVFGMIFSVLFNISGRKRKLTEEKLFAFPFLRVWKYIFGEKYLSQWVLLSQGEDPVSSVDSNKDKF